ncbi:MAG: glycosyltransferase family 39 protein [Bacteroidales bacterium]|nr:glycosyltransferase family 39 protein [Bacteroidales bacterium]
MADTRKIQRHIRAGKTQRTELFFAAAAFLAAAFLMFHHTGARHFWQDEALVANILLSDMQTFLARLTGDLPDTVYFVLLKAWSLVTGVSELSLRAFSVVSALTLVLSLFWITRSLINTVSAIWVLMLAATNVFLILYSNQARPYTFEPLLSLWAYFFMIRMYHEPGNRNFLIYAVINLLSLTHPWCFFIYAAQFFAVALDMLLRRYRLIPQSKPFLLRFSAGFLISLPAFAFLYYKNISSQTYIGWMPEVRPGMLMETLGYYSMGHVATYGVITAVGILLIFFFKSPARKRGKPETFTLQELPDRFTKLALISYFAVALIAAYLFSEVYPVFIPGRYTIMVLPAFLILMGWIWSALNRRWMMIMGFAVLLAGAAYQVNSEWQYLSGHPSHPAREIRRIGSMLRDGDGVIVTNLSYATVKYYLSSGNIDAEYRLFSFPTGIGTHQGIKYKGFENLTTKDYREEAGRIMEQLPSGNERLFVFYYNEPQNQELLRVLMKHYLHSEIWVSLQPVTSEIPINLFPYDILIFRERAGDHPGPSG